MSGTRYSRDFNASAAVTGTFVSPTLLLALCATQLSTLFITARIRTAYVQRKYRPYDRLAEQKGISTLNRPLFSWQSYVQMVALQSFISANNCNMHSNEIVKQVEVPHEDAKYALSLLNLDVLVAKTEPDPIASTRKRAVTREEASMLGSQLSRVLPNESRPREGTLPDIQSLGYHKS